MLKTEPIIKVVYWILLTATVLLCRWVLSQTEYNEVIWFYDLLIPGAALFFLSFLSTFAKRSSIAFCILAVSTLLYFNLDQGYHLSFHFSLIALSGFFLLNERSIGASLQDIFLAIISLVIIVVAEFQKLSFGPELIYGALGISALLFWLLQWKESEDSQGAQVSLQRSKRILLLSHIRLFLSVFIVAALLLGLLSILDVRTLYSSGVAISIMVGILLPFIPFRAQIFERLFILIGFRASMRLVPTLFFFLSLGLFTLFFWPSNFLVQSNTALFAALTLTGASLLFIFFLLDRPAQSILSSRGNWKMAHTIILAILVALFIVQINGTSGSYKFIIPVFVSSVMFLVSIVLSRYFSLLNANSSGPTDERGDIHRHKSGSYDEVDLFPIQYERELLRRIKDNQATEQDLALVAERYVVQAIPFVQDIEIQKSISEQAKVFDQRLSEVGDLYDFIESNTDWELLNYLARKQQGLENRALIIKMLSDSRYKVRNAAILATGYWHHLEFVPTLVRNLNDEFHQYAAKSALIDYGDVALRQLEVAFNSNKDKPLMQFNILEIFERVASAKSIDLLKEKLNSTNQRVVVSSIEALDRLGIILEERYHTRVRQLIDDFTTEFLKGIIIDKSIPSDENYNEFKDAVNFDNEAIRGLVDACFRLVYSKPTIDFIRSGINGSWSDRLKTLTAIDLQFDLATKFKAIDWFSYFTDKQLKRKFQEYFPTEYYNNVLYDLSHQLLGFINRDRGINGLWSKACAINLFSKQRQYEVPNEIVASLFSKDSLVQETAASSIYRMNRDYFLLYTRRLPESIWRQLELKMNSHEQDLVSVPKMEKILNLNKFMLLRDLTPNQLVELEDYFVPRILEVGKVELSYDTGGMDNYWLIQSGSFKFSPNGYDFGDAQKGQVFLPFKDSADYSRLYLNIESTLNFFEVPSVVLREIMYRYSIAEIGDVIHPRELEILENETIEA